ncbi:hypothetical protein Ahy_A06g030712 isoform B [Arachis hypogaea]|uniref:Uncharacterized protein n=1 Tax=Arachis hypogaea TaxID=3818 RepID=A0A445CX66_ARAHY|nr:hypothetical protein Ahy_A06g030712 isoform B [Arachis hypogaea]
MVVMEDDESLEFRKKEMLRLKSKDKEETGPRSAVTTQTMEHSYRTPIHHVVNESVQLHHHHYYLSKSQIYPSNNLSFFEEDKFFLFFNNLMSRNNECYCVLKEIGNILNMGYKTFYLIKNVLRIITLFLNNFILLFYDHKLLISLFLKNSFTSGLKSPQLQMKSSQSNFKENELNVDSIIYIVMNYGIPLGICKLTQKHPDLSHEDMNTQIQVCFKNTLKNISNHRSNYFLSTSTSIIQIFIHKISFIIIDFLEMFFYNYTYYISLNNHNYY